jgi:hypothetical protein
MDIVVIETRICVLYCTTLCCISAQSSTTEHSIFNMDSSFSAQAPEGPSTTPTASSLSSYRSGLPSSVSNGAFRAPIAALDVNGFSINKVGTFHIGRLDVDGFDIIDGIQVSSVLYSTSTNFCNSAAGGSGTKELPFILPEDGVAATPKVCLMSRPVSPNASNTPTTADGNSSASVQKLSLSATPNRAPFKSFLVSSGPDCSSATADGEFLSSVQELNGAATTATKGSIMSSPASTISCSTAAGDFGNSVSSVREVDSIATALPQAHLASSSSVSFNPYKTPATTEGSSSVSFEEPNSAATIPTKTLALSYSPASGSCDILSTSNGCPSPASTYSEYSPSHCSMSKKRKSKAREDDDEDDDEEDYDDYGDYDDADDSDYYDVVDVDDYGDYEREMKKAKVRDTRVLSFEHPAPDVSCGLGTLEAEFL